MTSDHVNFQGGSAQQESSKRVEYCNVCYWPCLIGQETEAGRDERDRPQATLIPEFFPPSSGAQDSQADQSRNGQCQPGVTHSRRLMHGSSDSQCYFLTSKLTSWYF